VASSDALVVPIAIAHSNYFIVDFYVISTPFRTEEKIGAHGQKCIENELLPRYSLGLRRMKESVNRVGRYDKYSQRKQSSGDAFAQADLFRLYVVDLWRGRHREFPGD